MSPAPRSKLEGTELAAGAAGAADLSVDEEEVPSGAHPLIRAKQIINKTKILGRIIPPTKYLTL